MLAGRFSLVAFYERRARRILPALFAMLAATTILGAVVMIPAAFEVYGGSVVATALSVSNIYFWLVGGYFTLAAASRPLLHTWSLGVEEQFYLAFPLLLMLLKHHSGRWTVPGVAIAAAASFALAVWLVETDPRAAFFMPFTRFWELALGALLALTAGVVAPRPRRDVAAGWIGLALIALAIPFTPETRHFPGLGAVPACLGAALVIHAGAAGPNPVSRLLGAAPLVAIGLLSYSLYLWHWPLLVLLQSFVLQRPLSAVETPLYLVAVAALGFLSWYAVERPFRRRSPAVSSARVLGTAGLASAALVAVGVTVHQTGGLPWRWSDGTLRYALAADDINPWREACDSHTVEQVRAGDVCRIGAAGAEPTVAVVGDSFGDALLPGIEAALARAGQSAVVLTRAGCNPLFGIDQKRSRGCRPYMDAVADLLARSPGIGTVVLVGRWTRIAEGTRFGSEEAADVFIGDAQSAEESYAENRRVFERAIARLPEVLAGKAVFVLAFVPEQPFHVPQAASLHAMLDRPVELGVERALFDRRQAFVRDVLTAAAGRGDIRLLDLGALLCDARRCRATEDGTSLYTDDNHPTRSAAIKYSGIFDAMLNRPVGPELAGPGPATPERLW